MSTWGSGIKAVRYWGSILGQHSNAVVLVDGIMVAVHIQMVAVQLPVEMCGTCSHAFMLLAWLFAAGSCSSHSQSMYGVLASTPVIMGLPSLLC